MDRQVDLRDFSKFVLDWGWEQKVDLTGEVAPQATDDLAL